ncbi:MAG TPA: hypothetical protein VFS76_11065 [Pyrinomonadaceae bacterium]|nr:hypothetical protein [Pyrinomonadaceae bacterium]
MKSSLEQNSFDELFSLLEPQGLSTESRFTLCRRKLVKFFVWRHCTDPDSLADETIVRLLKNVDQGTKISGDNPYSYVYAIAIHVFQEHTRLKSKTTSLTDVAELPQVSISAAVDGCGALCLKELAPEKRELLARYYLDSDDRNDTADEQFATINALRLRIYRIKQELKRCRQKCEKRSELRN